MCKNKDFIYISKFVIFIHKNGKGYNNKFLFGRKKEVNGTFIMLCVFEILSFTFCVTKHYYYNNYNTLPTTTINQTETSAKEELEEDANKMECICAAYT